MHLHVTKHQYLHALMHLHVTKHQYLHTLMHPHVTKHQYLHTLMTSWGLPRDFLETSWGPLGDLGTSWELLGDLLANLECSGRPALQSSNKTVNQLKLDTNKAAEFNSWTKLNLSASSIDEQGPRA